MKKIVGIAVLMFVLNATMCFAKDVDQKNISEIAEKIRAGKSFAAMMSYPAEQSQYLQVTTPAWIIKIDFRAKLCFYSEFGVGGGGITLVPCKAVKDGYPLLAPLIDWEK